MANTRIAHNSLVINLTGSDANIARGTISATGNVTGGNFVTSGLVRATSVVANVVGATVTTTANVQAGNLRTTGLISSTGNVTGGNLFTVGSVSAQNTIFGPSASITGAITAGTLNVGTLTLASVSTAGNVTGGNILTVGNMSTAGNNISGGNVAGLNLSTLNANGVINGGSLSVYGNITGGNVSAVGSVKAAAFLNTNGTSATDGPAFIATISSGQGLPSSPFSINQFSLIFNLVSQNINSGYNSSTGIFTAPRAGFYQVSAACAPGFTNPALINNYYSAALMGIYRNNVAVCSGTYNILQSVTYGGITYAAISASAVSSLIYLNVGDTLQCKLAYVTNAPTNFWNTYANTVPNYFQACWLRP